MPRSTREWAKRKLEEAVQNLNWAGTHCYEVREKYKELHPEVSDPLDDTLNAIEMIQDLIQKIRGSF